MTNYEAEYDLLAWRLTEDGVNVAAVEARLKQQQVETPSWGYADSGYAQAKADERGTGGGAGLGA